ncbi:MAG TPA: DUF4190 domain-containing protein [Streptosporangiaceae bacterium]
MKQGNGYAVAGVILGIFVPLLGLIFSIIGLVQSKARAGAGKTLSIVGIVLSIVVGVGATIAVVNSVVHSTAADPGCISAEKDGRQMDGVGSADAAAMNRDVGSPAALRADLQKFQTDYQSLQRQLFSAEGQAQHQSVKAQIRALSADITAFNSTLQATENGDVSQASQMSTVLTQMQKDASALDSTCSTL